MFIYNVSHGTWADHMLSPIVYFAMNNLDVLCGHRQPHPYYRPNIVNK